MIKPVITIQSAHRPHRVAEMNAALAPYEPIWYVPLDQADEYASAGAKVRPVLGELPMKPVQLNVALTDAFLNGHRVVTMDDDYESIYRAVWEHDRVRRERVTLVEAIEYLDSMLAQYPEYHLAGLTTTSNAFWAKRGEINYGMITGQILLHSPNDLRFDENLRMLEDLDYIIAHHVVYGGLVKLRDWLPNFHIFGRSDSSDKKYVGGYKDYRNELLQKDTLAYLDKKWSAIEDVVFEDNGLGESVQAKIKWAKLAAFSVNKMAPNATLGNSQK